MKQTSVAKATLGRLPTYLEYLKTLPPHFGETISATTIAKALNLGEVQVRKDLSAASGIGKPRIGYNTVELIRDLEDTLRINNHIHAVIVGAGKLGRALLDYRGFESYGIRISAAFDSDMGKFQTPIHQGIFSMDKFEGFCTAENIRLGIMTVPAESAQEVCDRMIACGIKAIWNFAPISLEVPEDVVIKQENLALSLAHLSLRLM